MTQELRRQRVLILLAVLWYKSTNTDAECLSAEGAWAAIESDALRVRVVFERQMHGVAQVIC